MIEYKTISNWTGYERREDVTNMPVSSLMYGSQNVFIQEGKKIVPSGQYQVLGQPKTVNIGIRSSYDEYINCQGIPLPIRETPNVDAQLRDVLEVWYNGSWLQISPNNNTAPLGLHLYCFAEWKNTDTTFPKLIWVNGNKGNDAINSWNGAIAEVSAVGASTLTIASQTWEALGFDPGSGSIVINGEVYTYSGGADTATLTGVSPTPVGDVNVGDIATDLFKTQPGVQNGATYDDFAFDICSMLYNQVYYTDLTKRNTIVSQIGNVARITSTSFTGTGLNNGSFEGDYTGTENVTYKVVIRRSTPLTNNDPALPGKIEFSGKGGNVLVFDASGYTDTNDVNVYQVKLVQQGGYGTPLGYNAYKNGNQINSPGTATALQDGSGNPLTGPNGNYTWPVDDGILFFLDPFYVNFFNTATDPTPVQPGDSWTFTYGVRDFVDIFRVNFDGTETQTDSDVGIPFGVNLGDPIPMGDGRGIEITFDTALGHNVGDTFTVKATAEVKEGFRDFTYTQPIRLPGEGANLITDRPVVALIPQEDKMQLMCKGGLFYETDFQLAADLSGETLKVKKIKSESQNEPQSNAWVTHIKNSVVYLNRDSELDELGRVEQITTQQTRTISDRIKIDLEIADKTNGHVKFFDNSVVLSFPEEIKQFIYDFVNGYWQPPQRMPIGRISVIDGKLVGHSYNTNESYLLFEGLAARSLPGDVNSGTSFVSRIVIPYNSYDLRYHKKKSTKSFLEGYKSDPTILRFITTFDYGGCTGVSDEKINPIYCIPRDNVSLGKEPYGKHGLGTNTPAIMPKFHTFVPHTVNNWYEASMTIECDTFQQQYGILSVGIDADMSPNNNSQNTSGSL